MNDAKSQKLEVCNLKWTPYGWWPGVEISFHVLWKSKRGSGYLQTDVNFTEKLSAKFVI